MAERCPGPTSRYDKQDRNENRWLCISSCANRYAAGKTAITVHFYGKRFEDIEFRMVGAGPQEGRVHLVFPKPGKDVTRILIEVDAPSQHSEVRIDVNQNESFFIGYGRMVFEVE